MTERSAAAPLVSVIIPAFNAEATLAETVESALASTYRDIEVVLIDDGSTDGTLDIGGRFAAQDRRIRVVRLQSNRGLSAALNRGFAEARGDYVARLDADDLWHATKIEKQLAAARAHPHAAFIYSFVRFIDGDSRIVRDGPRQMFPPRALCRSIYETIVGSGSSALVKASAVAEVGGLDEQLRCQEDLLLQVELGARHEIAFVPEYLVGYRLKLASLSKDTDLMLAVWRDLRQRFRRQFPDVPEQVHRWAHGSRCTHLAESFAWSGRYRDCAALLLEALRHDPAWTLRFLQYRLARHARRRFTAASATGPGPPFQQYDPREEFRGGRYDADAPGGVLARLHDERAQVLAELDRERAE